MSNRGVPEWFGEKKTKDPTPKGPVLIIVLAMTLLSAGGVAAFFLAGKPAPQPASSAEDLPPPTDPPPPPPPPEPAPPMEVEPPVEPPQPVPTDGGVRSSAEVRRGMIQVQKDMRKCYDDALKVAPDAEGQYLIRMTVAPSGSVEIAHITATGNLPPSVRACVEKVVHSARFSPASNKTNLALPVRFKKGD